MAKFLEEQKVEQDLELALDVIDVAAPQKKASAKKPARKTQEQRFQEKIAAF
jgi:hypothetical protein